MSQFARRDGRINWRAQYVSKVQNVIRTISGDRISPAPEQIELPVYVKTTAHDTIYYMYEFGGSGYNFGNAMIIGDAGGFPSVKGKFMPIGQTMRQTANTIQAEIPVWPGCVVGLASHNSGKSTFALYSITSVNEGDTKTDSYAKLDLLAFVKGADNHTGSSKICWYSDIQNRVVNVVNFVDVLSTKLYSTDCTLPKFIEWFSILPKQRELRTKFFEGKLASGKFREPLTTGLCDTDMPANTTPYFSKFETMYNAIVSRAFALEEKHRIVVVYFAHYFATLDEDKNIICNSEYSNLSHLITEARLAYFEENTPNFKVTLDDLVYTYIHNEDDTEGYISNDLDFDLFYHKHSRDYIREICDLKRVHDLRSGKIDESFTNPSTVITCLIFTVAAGYFYSDRKKNYQNGEGMPVQPAKIVSSSLNEFTLADKLSEVFVDHTEPTEPTEESIPE